MVAVNVPVGIWVTGGGKPIKPEILQKLEFFFFEFVGFSNECSEFVGFTTICCGCFLNLGLLCFGS